MQRSEDSGAVRPIYGSLGVKRIYIYILQLRYIYNTFQLSQYIKTGSENCIRLSINGFHPSFQMTV